MRQITPAVFSTAGLPEQRRVELWEDHNAAALIGLRCRTLTATGLEATEINLQLPRIHLARVRGNSHVVERDQALVRRRPAGSIALFFSLAGEAFFYHDDGVRIVRPGEMLMCDADRPFLRGFSQGLEELVVKIPRQVFADVTGAEHVARPVVAGFVPGANPFAHALARQVGAAVRSDDPRPVEEQALLDLIAALGGAAPKPHRVAGDASPAAHRIAAQAYIDRHFADPGLTAARVAAAIGLSTRHLSRVFAEAGTSVPHHVLARRLQAARAMLQESPASSVAEVAGRCGFTSPAHFSHAFRAHFGERATDVRRVASIGHRFGYPPS